MAMVTKTGATPTTATAVAARYAGTSPTVASVTQPMVEGAGGGVGLMFDNAAYGFRDERRGFASNDNARRDGAWDGSILRAPSQTFAAIMEAQGAATGSAAQITGGRSFQGILSRAISTYENNARIIHGQVEARGESVSMRL